MKNIRSHLHQFHLQGRRVLVRIDGNVPLIGTSIANDYRLQAVLPTLRWIQEHGGTIVLMTHMGRPKKQDPTLSTKILQPWFEQHGFTVSFAPDSARAYEQSIEKKYAIILLENLRFFEGETTHDKKFARELARLGDYFVQDAFATLHRDDTSITLVAKEFAPEHRTIGLLVEKELQTLSHLRTNPTKPFIMILGGGKPATKIPVISALLPHADAIIICPALVFTFLKAQGKQVGASLVDDALLATAKDIMNNPASASKLIFPIDYLVAVGSLDGPIITATPETFPHDGIGIGLGKQSLAQAEQIITTAGTIFFNCAMGFSDRKNTQQSSFALLQAIAHANAYSVIAGGNSVDITFQLGLAQKVGYLSTGGGATLYYLGGQPLPGLSVFM